LENPVYGWRCSTCNFTFTVGSLLLTFTQFSPCGETISTQVSTCIGCPSSMEASQALKLVPPPAYTPVSPEPPTLSPGSPPAPIPSTAHDLESDDRIPGLSIVIPGSRTSSNLPPGVGTFAIRNTSSPGTALGRLSNAPRYREFAFS
jgi:hypothetical protein